MALFSSAGGHSAAQHGNSNLVEFRAGKLNLRESNMVHPDKRKGLLYIHQSDDMLMHFCWKDRNTGTVEEDLIIFPDDTEFVKVKECTTGRVFLLKFKSTSRKLFFWMQEPKGDKDDELCKKVNDALNNPPTPGSRAAAGGGGGRGAQPGSGSVSDQLSAMNQALGLGASEQELNALAGMDQQQLMQFLNLMGAGGGGLDSGGLGGLMGPGSGGGGGGGSSAITSTPTIPTPSNTPSQRSATGSGGQATPAAPGTPAIQLSDLQSILAGMNIPAEAGNGPGVELDGMLSNQEVADVAGAEGNAQRLFPHLPDPDTQDGQELSRTVRSPQFRQAAGLFGSALQTGQLGPLMRQFGLGEGSVDAARRGDIESFAELLEEEEKAGSASSPPESADKTAESKDKQDGMDLD